MKNVINVLTVKTLIKVLRNLYSNMDEIIAVMIPKNKIVNTGVLWRDEILERHAGKSPSSLIAKTIRGKEKNSP